MTGDFRVEIWFNRLYPGCWDDLQPYMYQNPITAYRDGDLLPVPPSHVYQHAQERLIKRIENDKCEIERLTAACKQWEAKAYAKNAACAEAAMLLDRATDALKKAHAA